MKYSVLSVNAEGKTVAFSCYTVSFDISLESTTDFQHIHHQEES
jgi:hypothetical protein